MLPEIYNKTSPFWVVKNNSTSEGFNLMHQKFFALPENIKDLVPSEETASSIWQISQKYNLSEQQTSALAIATWKILSAQVPINKYIATLSEDLGITPEIAKNIAQEQNIKIFSKAALQIKKLQERNFPELAARQQQQPSAQPARNVMQSEYRPTTRRPEDRVVNLRQEAPALQPKKPAMIDHGPRIEGNIVDLSN